MGNKTKALVLCIVCQYDEIRFCMVFCISLYIPMQIHLTNIISGYILLRKYQLVKIPMLWNDFPLNIDSCYLWCDFYTDKSKTPFECLV